MAWMIWLAAFVLLTGIEAISMALTTIWFAGGALAAFVLALLGVGKYIQVGAFFLVSIVLLIFTRPFALKYVNQNTVKTNVESVVGKKARITAPVDNDLAEGAAVIGGQEWTARSADGSPIPEGTIVVVEAVSGVKLIVRKMEEGK